MTALNSLLDMDLSYPGIEIKVELIVMREYLGQLEVGIKSICDAYLDAEIKKYEGVEYYEYQHIYIIAEEEIPRLIRLPLVVSIYTLFENSMTQLLSYAQSKEAKGLSLKDINGRSPASTFNKYMEHVLGFDFKISNRSMDELSKINKIRNCIAHANGNLSAMSEGNAKAIRALKVTGLIIESSSLQLDVSYEFLKNSLVYVENVVRELMDFMENRYGFK
jgi:hypothetical protein